ncbi:hypothetical protein MIT9_P1925 [Methylomarinovum caldicuralii]|uniref:Tyr recombinase domain-containing protein n=1 Tax=Methylomarinovum caldicuralii TaxID=438856 RepID=A0AAU9CCN0_9GAMM|nr:integrase family protein [Methylomarinovum caldicuralii]BCX82339.1 hypothetical protein MIT9_P1925 [Methylomarinovum caldicuralii]
MDTEHSTGIAPPDKWTLTKRLLESIAPPSTGRRFVYDAKVPGLRVQVTAAGTKSFQLYRWYQGKPVKVTLGRFPVMTVEQARQAARKLLGEMAEGKNPQTEKRRRQAEAVTLAQTVDDYLSIRDLKPSTVADVRKMMAWGLADWQDKRLTAIRQDMVERRYQALCEKSPACANRTMRYLRAVLNFAMARYSAPDGSPILPANPVQRLTLTRAWKRVDRRRTLIKPHELPAWWQALEQINPLHADFFRLVLLTGLRKSEALELTWADIDLRGRLLTVTDTKARRPHALPLTDYLAGMLERRRCLAVADHVFADHRGRVVSNFRYSQAKVEAVSSVKFCIHDLRRTFITIAESLDIPAYALKRLLNHATGSDVTAGYIVIDTERLRGPMQQVTDYVLKAVGEKESAAVMPLRQKEA